MGLSPTPVYRVIVYPIAARSQNPQEVGLIQASLIPTGARNLAPTPVSKLVQAVVSEGSKAVVPHPTQDELQTFPENNETAGPRPGGRLPMAKAATLGIPKASHSM